MGIFKTIQECRICHSKNVDHLLDLGDQPPANSLRPALDEQLPMVPLRLGRCGDCGVVLIDADVDPAYLFSHYVWVTGTSSTAKTYAETFCERFLERAGQKPQKVFEVASNDGTFLKPFVKRGSEVCGFDPAQNIAEMAEEDGVATECVFFNRDTAQDLLKSQGQGDIIFARNVLPHVPDPVSVLAGMATLLKADGMGAIEFHYSGTILEELHYDSVYHEHFHYFSIKNLMDMLQNLGLHPFDIAESPISGGSKVLYFAKSQRPQTAALQQAIKLENQSGVNSLAAWQEFAKRAEQHRQDLVGLVSEVQKQGKTVVGYGASARSSTLLNFCQLDGKVIETIADKNELKHHKFTPGSDIPIEPPAKVLAEKPDVVVLLAWNFQKEIIGELRHDYGFTGEVVVPFPGTPKIIGVDAP